MKILLVGDVHSNPDELQDCETLLDLVEVTAFMEQVDAVVFMGDLYNTHDIVNVRCIEFWNRRFRSLKSKVKEVFALVGNHDQVTPTKAFPHSLVAHQDLIKVVDKPGIFLGTKLDGVAMIPYTHSPQEFVAAANDVGGKILLCHQTFQGATYENGFYAKDAVETKDIPHPVVFSGHIHSPQKISQVQYIGAPRWRTRSDANLDRHLWIVNTSTGKVESKVPTDGCRRIHVFTDTPEAPLMVVGYKSGDRLLVDVYGKDAKTVRDRESYIKTAYPGAITRGFPDKAKVSAVSESEGISVAFKKFSESYNPPLGTSRQTLYQMLESRLGQS
jgi:DNA repair exonuclease SbcCD nuclease subunit